MNEFTVVQLRDRPVLAEVVVVIDVIRAFTTAGAAFAAGAERIVCVEKGGLLRGTNPNPADLASAVQAAGAEHTAIWRHPTHPKHDSFTADLRACSKVDTYNFAMIGHLQDTAVVLRPVGLGSA